VVSQAHETSGALAPLLRNGPLSKDAVSRLVGRLREDFETWRNRDLADEDIRYVLLDGWFPKIRIGGRRARIPGLVTLGVRGDGQRVVLDLRQAGEESAASWARWSPASWPGSNGARCWR
jgi:transposase-like protein